MTPLVSYGIQTHPDRMNFGARRVFEQLGRRADVHVDTEGLGPWNSARKVWEATPGSCRWRVLLQDDIDLGPAFAYTLEAFLDEHGGAMGALQGRPLALYNGLKDEPAPGEHWLERQDGVQGPVIVLAAADVRPMLAWCHRHVRVDSAATSSDIRPSLWLEALGRTSLCPSPSWVQHRGHEPSLKGVRSTRSQPRTAPTFDPTRSLASIDWSLGLAPRRDRPVHGQRYGASARVRWHLWRTSQTKPDHELEQSGMDPRVYAALGGER